MVIRAVEKTEMFDEEDVGTTTTSKQLPVAYIFNEASRRTKAFRNYAQLSRKKSRLKLGGVL